MGVLFRSSVVVSLNYNFSHQTLAWAVFYDYTLQGKDCFFMSESISLLTKFSHIIN